MLRHSHWGVRVLAAGWLLAELTAQESGGQRFRARLYEDLPSGWRAQWSFDGLKPGLEWETPFLGVSGLPGKLSPAGVTQRRSGPYAAQIAGTIDLPAGHYDFQLRSADYARLYVDGRLIVSARPPVPKKLTAEEIAAQQAEENKEKNEAANAEARRQVQEQLSQKRPEEDTLVFNESVLKAVQAELIKNKRTLGLEKSDTAPPKAMQTAGAVAELSAGAHQVRLEFTGTDSEREISVAFRRRAADPFYLASLGPAVRFSEKGWAGWVESEKGRINQVADAARVPLQRAWREYWQSRHAALADGGSATASSRGIDEFIDAKLAANQVRPAAPASDYAFIRRLYLDVWGLIPTAEQVREFVAAAEPDKRARWIEKLVSDPKWADPWVSYWEDTLAENPKIFGRVANSSGPFKRWIHRSFVEDRGFDRFATELILMEGTDREEGTLGFAESLENDVPMAEKAFVLSQAFMAANMKCARCHDSPINPFRQRDLFGLAAMLDGKPVAIPATSSVGAVPGRRPPAVRVTTKPGERIQASFVFDPDRQADKPRDERQFRSDLADWLTSHRRFAEVGVNRIWKRFLGTGLVEPVDDWPAKYKASYPELLDYLVREFIASGFSIRHIQRLILNTQAYQRSRIADLAKRTDASGLPLFAAQPPRRMYAEEIVDSLHLAVRRPFKTERMAYAAVDYGYPKRMWEVVTLSNEEDNAILARPLLQEIIAAASAFGWRDQRPDPRSIRDAQANALQPLTLANGALVTRLTRLTDASYYTKLASREISLDEFTRELFLNTLSRQPSARESDWVRRRLEQAWDTRRVSAAGARENSPPQKPIQMVRDMLDAYRYLSEARQAEPATERLTEAFRKRFETILWTLLNSPEFVFVP